VAAIVPVSADELELPARLSDPQAERLWAQLAAQRRAGTVLEFEGPEEVVAHLAAKRPPRRPPSAGRPAAKRRRPA
jgi:hypothetical protein